MKILQIMPGYVENYYCENCLRDNDLVQALRLSGHDTFVVPLYIPVKMESTSANSVADVFFGGINVYLREKFSLYRFAPRWFDKLLDAPVLLRWAARKESMTHARDLAQITLSTLRGPDGNQKKELDRLIKFLTEQEKPDLICLSNALLLGFAEPLKESLGVPIICMLQDEDTFLDAFGDPVRTTIWQTLTENSRHVNLFITTSNYYNRLMRRRLNLNEDRVKTVYHGIFPDRYPKHTQAPSTPTIGFLSQLRDEKGLDLLFDAFVILRKNAKLKNLRLRIAGNTMPDHDPVVKKIKKALHDSGDPGCVEFITHFDPQARESFFKSLTLLSVPEKQGEAYGLYVLEALASGVPVVQPNNGVFPELLQLTGGGYLFNPNNVHALVEALEPILTDPDHAHRLGRQGQQGVQNHFDARDTVKNL
ncbi:MAG: glycosyltransferase family 4 protein, partial [Planctomycetes bacterium]|nr:glycosyltransferase family 4 protein [Planctomycetota bacterium]